VETKYGCEFCKREFLRESTVLKHLCEYKQRWITKDLHGNRIGFQSWVQFYTKNTSSKKKRTYEDFIKSAYYTAFVKFGTYCVDVNVINVSRFVDWLLKNQIKIDTWCQDTIYTKFLIEYLRIEDPLDAIARSVQTTIDLSEPERLLSKDYLRYGNSNKICYAITTGKISPWMLYHSDSGTKFLDKLDQTQVKIVIDYINPELWAIKFKREPENVQQVKELLNAGGY
jgi:hypothetical protein|tara:strand:+ start:157 stop:837 length:681 start_codon:yes stop_codon:yes gene_type:complete